MYRKHLVAILVVMGLVSALAASRADALSRRVHDPFSSVDGAAIRFTLDDEEFSSLENARVLIKMVDLLKKNRQARVKIVGYSDDVGTKEYNEMISLMRAEKVKRYLEERGIWSLRIETRGMGEADPVGDNSTAAGRAKNRRVELEVR